jgi:hypothetical protein
MYLHLQNLWKQVNQAVSKALRHIRVACFGSKGFHFIILIIKLHSFIEVLGNSKKDNLRQEPERRRYEKKYIIQ